MRHLVHYCIHLSANGAHLALRTTAHIFVHRSPGGLLEVPPADDAAAAASTSVSSSVSAPPEAAEEDTGARKDRRRPLVEWGVRTIYFNVPAHFSGSPASGSTRGPSAPPFLP